jgi:integrase
LTLCEAAVTKGNMAESTLIGYRRIIRNVLIPEFGAHRAHELGAAHIKAWVGRQDATAKRVRNVLSPLRVVLAGALNDGDIDRNPFDRLDLGALLQKTAKASGYEVDPFTQQERDAILAACRTDQERHLYGLWFETGLRTGELIALQWRHVDWVGRRLAVRDNYTAGRLKGPKTSAGVRDIELSDEALAVLRQQKALTGLADAHIFHNPRTGAAWEGDQAIRRTSWDHTCRLAGVRRRNPYQIRHTWGSRMVSAGYNLFWVAEQMGHETIEMVIHHYGHWMPGEGKKVRLDRHGNPVSAATYLPRSTRA